MPGLLALASAAWLAPLPVVTVEDAFDEALAAKWAHAPRLPVPGERPSDVVETPAPPSDAPAPRLVPTVALRPPAPAEPRHARLALAVEAGLPLGVGGQLQLAPIDWLRFAFGGGTNGVAPNVAAALGLAPFHSAVRPVLWGEVAHGFGGDAGGVLAAVAPALAGAGQVAGYDVAQLELSLELGSKWFCFFLRGGVSFVDVTLAPSPLDVGGATLDVKGGHLRALVPGGRLGLEVGLY